MLVSGPLSINDPSALVSAALEHAGVLLSDKSFIGDNMLNDKLVPVLNDYKLEGSLPMYIVYPGREFVPAKARTLIDFLLTEMPPVIEGRVSLS